jgi:hypothetical protein
MGGYHMQVGPMQPMPSNKLSYPAGGAGSNQYFGTMPGMFNPYSGGPSVPPVRPNELIFGGGYTGYTGPDGGGGGGPDGPILPPGGFEDGGGGGGRGGVNSSSVTQFTPPFAPGQNVSGPGLPADLGHGIEATGLQYPGLSADMAAWLTSQMGQGLSAFGGITQLPTGGQTAPGQLSAGMNPLLAQLAQFFQTGQGGSMPGMSTLADIANNGVSALPEWQSMVAAMGQNTAQNEAQLKEQFAGMGDLAGSPFATGISNYLQQTNLDQNALLGQLQQSNIQNIQMPAINELFQGSQAMAGGLQTMDQEAINRMYQQFQLDQPQNNPLLQDMMGMATLYPPTNKTPSAAELFNQGMSGAGQLMQGIGSINNNPPGGNDYTF